jgi:phage terminase Nu1 subunit (DNA packaging protein)
MEKIYIQENQEKIEATGEVLEQILADRQAEAQAKALKQAEAEAKAIAKAALLNKLGITAEEAQLLLGGN